MKRRQIRETPEGTEQRCSHCREWWPADDEFFRPLTQRVRASWCRACENEVAAKNRQQKREAVAHG